MTKLESLVKNLDQYPSLAIAVSGGVDSMLLAYVAHRFSTSRVLVMHACSPAVPASAFKRLSKHADKHAWTLHCIDARELDDSDYVSNPVDRCYFCKSNLFQRISETLTSMALAGNSSKCSGAGEIRIASGTNVDDLSDYRPGLKAAQEYAVVQPYVDTNTTKREIYQLAAELNLGELESLPAQPCLASRIETGIRVAANDLAFIDDVESRLAARLGVKETLRCRLTQTGVVLEFAVLPAMSVLHDIENEVKVLCKQQGLAFAGVRNYEKGSAFLIGKA